MQIFCPECDHGVEVPDEVARAGLEKTRCPGCGARYRVFAGGMTSTISSGASSSSRPAPSSSAPSGTAGWSGGGSGGLNFSTPAPGLRGSGGGAVPVAGSGSGGGAAFPPLNEGDEVKGKWRIEGEIGRGATAVVYRARDLHTDLKVALKVVGVVGQEAPRELVRNWGDEYKVRREISDSRHVLTIESPDVEVRNTGVTYVVLPMELAAKTFRQWMDETADDLEGRQAEGLELFTQACRGVAALHAAKITHLDLKPENLLLVAPRSGSRKACAGGGEAQWTMKVGDFGLAKAGTGVRLLPVAGEGVGTPRYMAPEQVRSARSKDIGPSADVYALGCILFELLDGEPPFDGRTAEEVRTKHLDLAPPELTNVEPWLTEVVRRSLKKERRERPSSAMELLDLLATNPAEEAAYGEAEKSDSIENWENYLSQWPKGRRVVEAQAALRVAQHRMADELMRRGQEEKRTKREEASELLSASEISGNDLLSEVRISPIEARVGCSKTIMMNESCKMWSEVNIPAGVFSGQVIRIVGAGTRGTPAGDLLLTVTIDTGWPCSDCNGTGMEVFRRCQRCHGEGRVFLPGLIV